MERSCAGQETADLAGLGGGELGWTALGTGLRLEELEPQTWKSE